MGLSLAGASTLVIPDAGAAPPAGDGIGEVAGGAWVSPATTPVAALKRNHGFVLSAVGAQQSTLSYAVGSREVTLTPTGVTTPVYVNGVLYNLPATTKAHTAVEGVHVFYFDVNGVAQVSVGFPALPWNQFSIYAVVYYSTSGAAAQGLLQNERHTSPRDLAWHQQQHYSVGTVLKSGCAISAGTYTLNTDSDVAVTPGFVGGTILDEDLETTVGDNAEGTYLLFRRTGTFWRWDSASFPFPNSGGYPAWDNAGVLTALSGAGQGQWVNVWVLAVPAVTGAEQWIFVTGQAVFSSLASAQAESVTSLMTANLPFVEMTPRYQLTYRARSTYGGTYKCRLEAVTQLIGTKASLAVSNTLTANAVAFTPSNDEDWGDSPRGAVSSAMDSLASGDNRRKTLTLIEGPTDWTLIAGTSATPAPAPTIEAGPVLRTTYSVAQDGIVEGLAVPTAPTATHPINPKGWDFRVTLRVVTLTGADGNTILTVGAEDAGRNFAWGVRCTIGIAAGIPRSFVCENRAPAFYDSADDAPVAGEWYRVTFRGCVATVECGAGDILKEVDWRFCGVYTMVVAGAVSRVSPTILRVGFEQTNAPAVPAVYEVDSITLEI